MSKEKQPSNQEQTEEVKSQEEAKTEEVEVTDEVSTQEKETEDDSVTLSKEKFNTLVSRLQRLESAADKGRLSQYDNLNRSDVTQTVGLRKYNNRIIKEMYTVENTVEKSPQSGVWQENQVLEIHFFTGAKEIVPYVSYVRNYTLIPATIKKRTQIFDEAEKEKHGEFLLEVETEDGRQYTIGSNFIN